MQTPPINDTETFNRFKELIDKLKTGKDKILLIHDADGDGLSSGKILIESMQKLGIKIKFRFAAYDRTNLFGDFLLEFIDKNRITTIFTTDVGIYSTNFKDKKEGERAFTLWLFNPFTIVLIYAFSNIDLFAVLLTLIAFLYIKREKLLTAAVFIGLAVSFKLYALLFVPFLILKAKNTKENLQYAKIQA